MKQQQAQVGWLESAIEHYDACLALGDRTAGNVLFQQRVLACSCRALCPGGTAGVE